MADTAAKPRPHYIRRLASSLAILAFAPPIGALAASLAWPFELLAHFHGCYALGLSGVFLVLLVLRCWRTALAALTLAIVDAAFVLPLYLTGVPASASPEIRILQANVNSNNRRVEHLLELIQREQPDVIAVIEVNRSWARDLERIHDNYPYRVLRPREDNFGIALYSKRELETGEVVGLGGQGLPSILAEIELRDLHKLTLVATHPLPPSPFRAPNERDAQLHAVGEFVAERDGAKVVFGDLNTSSWSSGFQQLCEVGGLRDGRLGFGLQPTWPGRLARIGIAIDHVLVGDRISVTDYRVGPNIGSDHRPVIVDLAVLDS